MNPTAHLPLFVGDFLASTVTWPGDAKCVYAFMLMAQWSAGALPVDPDDIARRFDIDPALFKRAWAFVGDKFPITAAGRQNARLERTRAITLGRLERMQSGGRTSAMKRWGSQSQAGKPVNSQLNKGLNGRVSKGANATIPEDITNTPERGKSDSEGRAAGAVNAGPAQPLPDRIEAGARTFARTTSRRADRIAEVAGCEAWEVRRWLGDHPDA